MTDHKFTDEEVIKALEHCGSADICDDEPDRCFGCPLMVLLEREDLSCFNTLLHDLALDLINRQKAEIAMRNAEINAYSIAKKFDAQYFNADIDRLEKTIAELRVENHILATEYTERVRAEAIKEFAERLCEGRVSNDAVVIAVQAELKILEEKDHENISD